MATPRLAATSCAVLIRGGFKPLTITPSWLHANQLIGSREFGGAQYEWLVPGQMAVFTAGWLRCQVQNDLLQVSTDEPEEFERIRDIAVGILTALPDTSAAVMGLNRHTHITVPSLEAWHAVGDALTPKDVWDGVLLVPGMRTVVLWGARPDLYSGHIHVHIGPSGAAPLSIEILHNDHFNLSKVETHIESRLDTLRTTAPVPRPSVEKAAIAVEILIDEWQSSMRRSDEVVKRIARLTGV